MPLMTRMLPREAEAATGQDKGQGTRDTRQGMGRLDPNAAGAREQCSVHRPRGVAGDQCCQISPRLANAAMFSPARNASAMIVIVG